MPDGRGSFFDVLERAEQRGLDVRLLPWRPDGGPADWLRNTFWGSVEHRAALEDRQSRLRIRWDRAQPGFCQHQKIWLIDAGRDGETAFVGGINQNPHSMVAPGHRGEGQNHDVYLEMRGPSVVDVHHNFAQRWNEASEMNAPDGTWGEDGDLAFPERIPAVQGDSTVQIQRTIHKGRYADGRATPGGQAHDIWSGERSILDQYGAAIGAARRTIYIENQYLDFPEIVRWLREALMRAVDVIVLTSAENLAENLEASAPERVAFLKARAALREFERFSFVGIAGLGEDGARKSVYVHAKLMLVDDEWATVGSANFHHASQTGNAEMNASFYDPAVVKALRCELFAEHLGEDTSHLDDREALRRYREIAAENRIRQIAGDPDWQGLVVSSRDGATRHQAVAFPAASRSGP
jgi:phosphatidylserine/phosphatidylglycerophosphate/cardiolipin synthase-like enzyme